MNNKKFRVAPRVILPLLFCSAAVLAGDGGLDAPYGKISASSVHIGCDSGDPSRGSCANAAAASHATTAVRRTAVAAHGSAQQVVQHPVQVAAASNVAVSGTAVSAPSAKAVPNATKQVQQLGNDADGFLQDETQTSSANTGYVGGRTRIGVGIDSEFKGKADLSHVFTESEDSALIGQGYLGVNPKKDENTGHVTGAGAQLNYHWVSKDESGQATHVNKVFGAYDQNGKSDKDVGQAKKVTVGYGQENESMFWSGHVMKGLSKKQDTGQQDAQGNTVYEKAYDWGVGGRAGTYLADQQMRVQGGLDYEWGTEKGAGEKTAKQLTVTGGVEKFFPGTPHSVNANIDVYKKSGGYGEEDSKAQVRGGVGYRYDIASDAGIWQPDQIYRRVRTEIPGEVVKTPAKIERKLVKHTMELESDTFFKVDSAVLTPEAQERLQAVAGQIRASGHEGNIRITGNTCDIGTTEHNQALSERRAKAVREFLIKCGFNADQLLAQGLGETSPKYPNTDTERHKNRRVDIEYVCYQNQYKDQVVQQGGTTRTDPKVVWKQELIPTPPLWVRQALHNVADHKQRVDTYKTTATDGNQDNNQVCTDINASDDANNNVNQDSSNNVISVLNNDKYCSQSQISNVSAPSHGTVKISDDGKTVIYTPAAGYTGTDTFTYTISDGAGHTSTATVTVTVGSGGTCPADHTIKAVDDASETVKQNSTDNIIKVLANDNYCDSTTITKVGTPAHGTVKISSDGRTVVYTPTAGYTGTDTFTYTLDDGAGHTSTATVTINVQATGCVTSDGSACPKVVAYPDTYTWDMGNGVMTKNVLDTSGGNTADAGSKIKVITSYTSSVTTNAAGNEVGGSVSIQEDGTFTFDPKGIAGEHRFKYQIQDQYGQIDYALVIINVTGTAACPVKLTDKVDSKGYVFSNTNPATLTFNAADYVPTGAEIEQVYMNAANAGQSTESTRYLAITASGNQVDGGALVRNGNTITFTQSGTYCKTGDFTFYIKVKGCSTVVTVTVTLNETSGNTTPAP